MQRAMDDISEIVERTIEMGDLALSMLETSVNTLDRDDSGIVEKMRTSRARILELDDEIEEKAFRILMIYHPMSTDMRLVATILKMITYFERLGKYGYNIAKSSIDIKDGKASPAFRSVTEMGRIAVAMVKETMGSLRTMSVSELTSYAEMEDKLDELRRTVLKEAIEFMKDHPDRVDDGNSIISASRYLERAGDYSCKLAEKIAYMITGKRIER